MPTAGAPALTIAPPTPAVGVAFAPATPAPAVLSLGISGVVAGAADLPALGVALPPGLALDVLTLPATAACPVAVAALPA
jgi:hypothetical protein